MCGFEPTSPKDLGVRADHGVIEDPQQTRQDKHMGHSPVIPLTCHGPAMRADTHAVWSNGLNRAAYHSTMGNPQYLILAARKLGFGDGLFRQ